MDINNIVNSTRMRNARLLDDINSKILNREYYKFKYLPFEGALPGLYFQQQTEDAINDIGNVAYATEEVADEALKVAQQAYNIALAALETANNALAAAQTAQQTANTALNIANNALSVGTAAATAAAAAQKRADEAYDLADAAKKAADAAQNTADAAQEAANNAANDATNALTKAEDALTKIEQLSVLNYYNNVTEATDVNTLVDVHRWYLQASNNPNAPETNSGFLNVDNDYNDSVCKQLWVSKTTGAIYNRFGQIVENSDPATVSSWSEWYKLATKADIDGTTTDLTKKITTVANNLATHEADFSNPHKVTAEQLGLTTVYQYKGSVATYANLPTTGQKVGDVWNVETADPDHGIKAGDNVAWDGAQWDILGGNHDLSGYAQLNSANTFTALNTFRANITVSSGTTAGSQGQIILGNKPQSATVQANIISSTTGALNYIATENAGHYFNVGTVEVANIGGTANTATLDLLSNHILFFDTKTGLTIGGGGTGKTISFYPEGSYETIGMNLSNQTETIDTDYSILSLQRNSHLTYTNNAALQVGSFKFLEIDKTTQNLTLSVNGVKNGTANILFESSGDRLAQIDYNGTLSLKENLIVGSIANTNLQNGVIRAGNSENCLYFCGTAENTYYSTPNTGNVIRYQSSANCYLINCAINNPSSLTMNFEGMDFKATVGSVPYMCKTLTFWLPVAATVPAVTWTFPAGSAVYYPKGVAPTLTANANNIINVIAIVDDTDSFSIQVCDTVVLPYSG